MRATARTIAATKQDLPASTMKAHLPIARSSPAVSLPVNVQLLSSLTDHCVSIQRVRLQWWSAQLSVSGGCCPGAGRDLLELVPYCNDQLATRLDERM